MSSETLEPTESVPGQVQIVTEQPIVLRSPVTYNSAWESISEQIEERPWVVPAFILGLLAVLLAWRRRR